MFGSSWDLLCKKGWELRTVGELNAVMCSRLVWQLDFRPFPSMLPPMLSYYTLPSLQCSSHQLPCKVGQSCLPLTYGEQKLWCLTCPRSHNDSPDLASRPSFLFPTQVCLSPVHCSCIRANFKYRQAEWLYQRKFPAQILTLYLNQFIQDWNLALLSSCIWFRF